MRKVGLVFLVLVVAHNIPDLRRAKQLLGVLLFAGLISVAYAGWNYAAGVGLRIRDLQLDSPFYQAGIRDSDVLLRVDDRLIRRPEEFLEHLRAKPPDEPLRLRVVHGEGIAILKDAVSVAVPAKASPRPNSLDELGMRIERTRPSRARGFYSHYVSYAEVLELLTALAFGLWLGHRHRFSVVGLGFIGLWLTFAIALGATLTRAAWVTTALGCLLQVWFHIRRWSVRVVLPAILLLAAAGTNVAMHKWRGVGLVDSSDPGTEYRLLMWRDGLLLIKEHPWFGVGLRTIQDSWWKFHLAAYKRYPDFRSHFHSTPIQLAVELGLPVLIAWLALMGVYWYLLVRLVARTREQADATLYGMMLGVLGGTTGFLAGSLVHYNFGDSIAVMLFWFLAGVAVAVRRHISAAAPSWLPAQRPRAEYSSGES
jgi:O-Antigen ligase